MLGPGGFGVTYLARDLRFERDVAIKEYFPAEFAYRDGTTTIRSSTRGTASDHFEQGKRYFLDEARTLAKFRHEHIVRVLNLFEQNNTAYMVLEFEEGQSFKNWLRTLGRRPTQAELDAIATPLLSALELVHAKGMFHRDIAPDNIIVRPSGQPVLIDFGAARHFVREHSHTIGAIVKHGYSPPEQYTLDFTLQGAWSDIYSLSATLYAAIMGGPPEEAAKRQLSDSVLPIWDRLDARQKAVYRPSFIAAIESGLALKPKERPNTIAAFRALLATEAPAVAALPALAEAGRAPIAGEEAGEPRAQTTRRLAAASPTSDSRARIALSPRRAAQGAEPLALAGGVGSVGPLDAAPAQPIARDAAAYPEAAARTAGVIALGVAALAAFSFLQIGGIEHPGGLAAAVVVCGGLLAAGIERAITVTRSAALARSSTAVSAAVMSTLALAVYWMPLFLWPLSLLLVLAAGLFGVVRFGAWVPRTLAVLAVLHLLLAGALVLVSARSAQKDPVFLPMMAVCLAALAALVLTSAIEMRRRWEPATP